jgi:hypothetical protein
MTRLGGGNATREDTKLLLSQPLWYWRSSKGTTSVQRDIARHNGDVVNLESAGVNRCQLALAYGHNVGEFDGTLIDRYCT